MNTQKKRKKKNQKEKETFSMDVTDRWETTGSSERWRNWKIPSLPSYSCLPLSYDINNAVAAALSSSRGVEKSNNIQTKLNEGSAMIPSDSSSLDNNKQRTESVVSLAADGTSSLQ